ncbi:MAG TPA: hypothetical protein VE175_07650 [Woeseiaceae bacterium]|jgi:hypothetical protein|nr:hypothetical protein [Woeseiaceae bacterium]
MNTSSDCVRPIAFVLLLLGLTSPATVFAIGKGTPSFYDRHVIFDNSHSEGGHESSRGPWASIRGIRDRYTNYFENDRAIRTIPVRLRSSLRSVGLCGISIPATVQRR